MDDRAVRNSRALPPSGPSIDVHSLASSSRSLEIGHLRAIKAIKLMPAMTTRNADFWRENKNKHRLA